MAKNTHWLTDGFGSKALVEGVDGRDRWKPFGWSESDAPAGDDRVWMEHEVHGGRAQFPAGIAPTWEALGWKPSPPPEPYDVTKDPTLVDVPTEAPAQPESKSTKPAGVAGSDKKE